MGQVWPGGPGSPAPALNIKVKPVVFMQHPIPCSKMFTPDQVCSISVLIPIWNLVSVSSLCSCFPLNSCKHIYNWCSNMFVCHGHHLGHFWVCLYELIFLLIMGPIFLSLCLSNDF